MEKKKRAIAISGESHEVDEVCTFQVHSRKRVQGKLKPVRSKSLSVENVSLEEGIKIVRLGVDLFKTQKLRAVAGQKSP